MRVLVLLLVVILPSTAIADSCLTVEKSTVINMCQTCREVTVRELQPRGEQTSGLFTGQSRTDRLEPGERRTLQSGQGWAVSDLKACQ